MSKLVTSGTGHDPVPVSTRARKGARTPRCRGDKKNTKTGFGFKGNAKIFCRRPAGARPGDDAGIYQALVFAAERFAPKIFGLLLETRSTFSSFLRAAMRGPAPYEGLEETGAGRVRWLARTHFAQRRIWL
jgi:hypothetical protein